MTVKFLTEDSLALLLQQPDPHRSKEFRKLFYMVLMYDTGCRNQELLDMKLADFHADAKSPFVVVTGKGNKTRVVPVMKKPFCISKNTRHYFTKIVLMTAIYSIRYQTTRISRCHQIMLPDS